MSALSDDGDAASRIELATRDGVRAIRNVDYIVLLCDDVASMRRFYTEALQFAVHDEEPGHWVAFQIGSLWLALRPRGRAYDGLSAPRGSAGVQLSFRVPPADVDIAYQSLLAHGVEVIEPPTNQDWPHRTLFVHDPEHNIIEIFADIHPRDTAQMSSGLHREMPSPRSAM